MAYITFDPSNESIAEILRVKISDIEHALHSHLPKLGVAKNDIVIKVLLPYSSYATSNHIEIILKTDNPKVTAEEIVEMLNKILTVPFEVSRIPVGNMVIELMYEIRAWITKKPRNWASNYQ